MTGMVCSCNPYPPLQEVEKDVPEQREKLPPILEEAEEEYAPEQWLRDKMAALEDIPQTA